MDMQDKELDRLFQQKLDDLEIQPSARVWQGISADLDQGKRKRILVPVLSAAASVLLVITAGILFIPKHPVKNSSQHNLTEIAQTPKAVQPAAVKNDPVVPPASVQNKMPVNPVIAPVNNLARVNKTKLKSNLSQPVQLPVIDEKPSVDAHTDEPMLAANTPAIDYHVVKAAAPDTATKINPKPAFINNQKVQPELIAQVPSSVASAGHKPVKKHRIRSMGDVFNIVIAAVDKRKDKIIEFSNTDDDDAVITGVNLGLVKVKKEK